MDVLFVGHKANMKISMRLVYAKYIQKFQSP